MHEPKATAVSSRALSSSALLFIMLCGCDAFDASRLAPAQRIGAQAADMNAPDASDEAPTDGAPDAGATHDARMQDPDDVFDEQSAVDGEGDEDASAPDEPDCGACGCDAPDADKDETPDCADLCPDDPEKTKAGACGCNHPDRDEGSVVSCTGLIQALAHRYSFEGDGAAVVDSFGSKSGVLMGTASANEGALELTGTTSGPYVDLPNGMISALSNASFEAWVSWTGASDWERIFDFGDSSATTEDTPDYGASYLFLSPRVNIEGVRTMRAAFTHDGDPALVIVDGKPLPTTGVHHVAVVVDDSNDQLSLYMDGVLQGSAVLTESLSSVRDINNWLGRSQFSGDRELSGALHEVRIYDEALSADQIALSYASGPDPEFLELPQ